MPLSVASAFLSELAAREPGARRVLDGLRPLPAGDERDRALRLIAFAMVEWLGEALEYAKDHHPDIVERAGHRIDEFRSVETEEVAREAGRFALAIADLARQARADDLHDLALHVGLAALATAERDWPLAGRRAALAVYDQGGGAVEAPIEAEAVLRAIGALED